MGIPLVEKWERGGGRSLDAAELEFVEDVARLGPQTTMWREGRGRRFERLQLEGLADDPVLVCYFRAEAERPGMPLAYEWPLDEPSNLDFAVWMANLMELLDQAGAGNTLPREPGADGIARRRAWGSKADDGSDLR